VSDKVGFFDLFFETAYYVGVVVGAFFTHIWHVYLIGRLRRRMRHGDQADLEAKLREYHERWHDQPYPKHHYPKKDFPEDDFPKD
jgi:hypothetical protein